MPDTWRRGDTSSVFPLPTPPTFVRGGIGSGSRMPRNELAVPARHGLPFVFKTLVLRGLTISSPLDVVGDLTGDALRLSCAISTVEAALSAAAAFAQTPATSLPSTPRWLGAMIAEAARSRVVRPSSVDCLSFVVRQYGTAIISRLDWIFCRIVDIACQRGNIQRPN